VMSESMVTIPSPFCGYNTMQCVSWHWKFITEQVAGFIGYLGAPDKRRLGGEILR